MRARQLFRFVIQAVTAGLAAAFVLLVFFPELLERGAVHDTPPALAPTDSGARALEPGPVSYADAVSRAAPAVVNIRSAIGASWPPGSPLESPFGAPAPGEPGRVSLGSGVIIGPGGYLLTNNHLIAGAQEIQVLLQDGRTTVASVVGTDSLTDLAVLKLDLPDLPSMSISRSSLLRVGDVVLAIGNPFGVGQTVTMGIVSAVGRDQLGLLALEDFIQTDAAINPGNSGGALIDTRGRLVGINTAIFDRSNGIGFAIPVDLAEGVIHDIIERGYPARGWLGAEVKSFPAPGQRAVGSTPTAGVQLAGVVPGGPASRAGLRAGDIITHINGASVATPGAALKIITSLVPGSEVRLAVVRDGAPRTFEASVGERPPEP